MGTPVDVSAVKEGFTKAVDDIGEAARTTSTQIVEQIDDFRDAAQGVLQKLTAKKADPYEDAVADYNGAFTAMSDTGLALLRLRERSTDLIELVELLVNSIANTPKSFATDFDEIDLHRARFRAAEEFAREDLEAARLSAVGAGAGFTAGAAVASMAPTAAMWVATTFGTASTGTAISALSGAAASQAALAWLGGGALAAGGGGTAAGGALLALAGPIGWGVAGAALLASIALFAKKKFENREAKQEALSAIKQNTARVRGMEAQIGGILHRADTLRERLLRSYVEALNLFGADFTALPGAERSRLAALVNNTKACAALLSTRIEQDDDE